VVDEVEIAVQQDAAAQNALQPSLQVAYGLAGQQDHGAIFLRTLV